VSRLHLSPPHLSGEELGLVAEALASNWVAPLGPQVDQFERELAATVGVGHAAAVTSGTAAIHLALRLCGVGPGDEVLVPTLTFCATANPVCYLGAKPVFLDVDPASYALDPALLADELAARAARGRLPKVVITVDLYGQSADHQPILALCAQYGVAVVEDAAEALGATYRGRPVGGFGRFGAFSFNGNKIITTSGGGMLVGDDGDAIERARFLASQARDPAPHYEHSTIGYNYRLSNLCAAVGRAQLRQLPARVEARRAVFARYREALAELPGVRFMPEPAWGRSTRWLTVLEIDPRQARASREEVRLALAAADIDARPVWKPLHLQPVFAACARREGGVAERLFAQGLCLPSGSNLAPAEQQRVIDLVRQVLA
jgi:dTDP-4-amino-4,6-dideoxygalactose transaminase